MIEESPVSLHIPMDDILHRLNILNGFIQLLAHQLDIFQQAFKQSYEERGVDSSNVFAAFALLIPDLSTPIDHHFLSYVHGGGFIKQGDEYFKAGEEFVLNWSSWTIAQSFEAFETFLRDIAAYYFFIQRPNKAIGSLRQIPIDVENIDAWKCYFRERQWEPSTIINLLHLTGPTIEKIEKHNILRLDLPQWFLLYTAIRHAITHSNSRLSRNDIKASSATINNLLPVAFPGLWEGDIYIIRCPEKNAKEIIQITGAYAYLIYKRLCLGVNIQPKIDVMKS